MEQKKCRRLNNVRSSAFQSESTTHKDQPELIIDIDNIFFSMNDSFRTRSFLGKNSMD
jgi:hypothetical protein